MLKAAAERGVEVRVIVYKEVWWACGLYDCQGLVFAEVASGM